MDEKDIELHVLVLYKTERKHDSLASIDSQSDQDNSIATKAVMRYTASGESSRVRARMSRKATLLSLEPDKSTALAAR